MGATHCDDLSCWDDACLAIISYLDTLLYGEGAATWRGGIVAACERGAVPIEACLEGACGGMGGAPNVTRLALSWEGVAFDLCCQCEWEKLFITALPCF